MKRLILVFCLISLTLVFVSCNKKDIDNKNKLNSYDDFSIVLDSKTKLDIEEAFYNKFHSELEWCNPKEVDSFESLDDLEDFCESYTGIRLYGIFDDTYVLCEFGYAYAYFYTVYELCYNDFKVIPYYNYCYFQPPYHRTFIYSNGEIDELDYNLSYISDISENDALKIKETHDKYIENHFYKFLNEEEKKNNDYNSAYNRIKKELTPPKELNETTSETGATSEIIAIV